MYPEGVRVYIDGKDVTNWMFGQDSINPSDAQHSWFGIDITQFVREKGRHVLEITAEAGAGRVEAVVEIF